MSGGPASVSSYQGMSAFTRSMVRYEIGGETEMAPGWFLTGALAYQTDWLRTAAGTQRATGQSGSFGAALRREIGPWSLQAATFGSGGGYSTTRQFSAFGAEPAITGAPSLFGAGVRLGAAYTVQYGPLEVRPQITLDGIWVGMPAFREGGASFAAASFQPASQGTFVATPAVELSHRFALGSDLAARVSVFGGISLLSNSAFTTTERLGSAPSSAHPFSTSAPMGTALARAGVGVELLMHGPYSLRAEYSGAFSRRVSINAGTLNFAATF